MPRYSFDDPDSIKPDGFVRVIDGDSREVEDCVLADTETGEVIREVLNPERTGFVKFSEFRPLPLKLLPLGG
jgi:hypothetical protein